jgi:hypothetical protein
MAEATKPISKGQMRRLQALYGQLARHSLEGGDRAARLAWASELVRRPLASFSDLTQAESRELIDTVQGQLGIQPAVTHRPRRRRRLSREDAQKAGTEGRRGQETTEVTLAGPAEFARIEYALGELGWNQEQFGAWLRSPRSPLGKRSQPEIRTLGDANRVWWALKRMLDRRRKS